MDDWHYQPARDLGQPSKDRLRSPNRETGLLGTLSHHAWWAFASAYLKCFQHVEIYGREHLPEDPPFILAANHSSHLDVLLLATALPAKLRTSIFPIAAGDTFFQTPVKTLFSAGMMNALPLWRRNCGRHALEQLRQRLIGEPCAYILFPEGTRSRTGQMGPFKPGLGMLMAGTAAPLIPCHLRGTFDAFPPNRRSPRRAQITLRIGPALRFENVPNTRDGWNQIASETEAAIRALGAIC